MSHAIRNSIILLVVLLLFVGICWGYVSYYQVPEKDQLQTEVDKKHRELKTDQQIADRLGVLQQTYKEASDYFNNYDKALYRSSNEDDVYDFLNSVNRNGAFINFNFAFTDSTLYPKYGVLNMEISGDGKYRNVVNFIRSVELSKPLDKIKNVSLTPINEDNEFDMVSYSFNLESYYDRSKILEEPSYDITNAAYASVHNPFFPLIRDLKPNETGKVDISQSRLVALSTTKAFLIDQNGVMQQVSIGGEVYLGKLSSLNLNKRTATFTLNEGGIVTNETLGINNDN